MCTQDRFESTLFCTNTMAASLPSGSFKLNYGLTATRDMDFIYIDGKTFENKDRLKALGAKWVPELKAWMCGADTDLSSLYLPAAAAAPAAGGAGAEAAHCGAAPRGAGGADPEAAPRKKITLKRSLPREELNMGLKAILSPDAVYIKGHTYENRALLGSLGGRWDAFEKAYVFPAGFDLTPLRVPAGEDPIRIPVPEPKPWWFCGHPRARIVALDTMSHTCPDCPQSDDFYDFYVRGKLYRGD